PRCDSGSPGLPRECGSEPSAAAERPSSPPRDGSPAVLRAEGVASERRPPDSKPISLARNQPPPPLTAGTQEGGPSTGSPSRPGPTPRRAPLPPAPRPPAAQLLPLVSTALRPRAPPRRPHEPRGKPPAPPPLSPEASRRRRGPTPAHPCHTRRHFFAAAAE